MEKIKNKQLSDFHLAVLLISYWDTCLLFLMEHNSKTKMIPFMNEIALLLSQKCKINLSFQVCIISLTPRDSSYDKVMRHLPG